MALGAEKDPFSVFHQAIEERLAGMSEAGNAAPRKALIIPAPLERKFAPVTNHRRKLCVRGMGWTRCRSVEQEDTPNKLAASITESAIADVEDDRWNIRAPFAAQTDRLRRRVQMTARPERSSASIWN